MKCNKCGKCKNRPQDDSKWHAYSCIYCQAILVGGFTDEDHCQCKQRKKRRKERKKRKTKVSETQAGIIRLLPALSDSMIAKEVGCSREFVRQVRKEKKIESPMKNQPCRPNDEEYVRIILRRMKELVPKSLIAKELGTTITTLLNICNRYGIKTPEGYPITLTMRHAMLLYKAKPDITQSEIARILGVEPPVITRAFRFLEKEHIEWQPFQSQGRSMFDEYMDAIEVLMKKKVPITKISQLLGVNYNSLYVHLKKIRKKKEEI